LKIEDLKEYDGEDRIISSYEMELEQRKNKTAGIVVRSGLPSLDRALEGGFQTGELYAVSGQTKQGKTLLCQSLTRNAYLAQHFALWFSYEVPARQFLSQFLELPLLYMPKKLKSADMKWLEERIMESFVKFHTRMVFIDHLHFLFDLFKSRNPSLEIGTVIRKLKTMAVDNDLIIFLLCHTSKAGGDAVTYQSIRDSSFVAQESDSVFLIARTPKEGDNKAALRVEFHRRTGVIESLIKLQKVMGYLCEPPLEGSDYA
jgi:archaellum biogenesis ATPase FlaH